MGGTFAIAPPMSREERLTYIENLRKDLGMHTEGEKNAAVVAHPLLSDGEQKPQVAGDVGPGGVAVSGDCSVP